MALIKWDPLSELNSLHAQVNSLFNDTFGGISNAVTAGPVTDVYSNEKELCIESHLPGFKDNEVSVQQHEDDLEITAEHREQDKQTGKDRKYMMRESVNRYYRRFALPKNVDTEHIDAQFKDGVLKLAIPYKELPAPKKIAIKAQNK